MGRDRRIYDFDRDVRHGSADSIKWQTYGGTVIPLWVADMDFVSADPIIEALHHRVDEGVFGYTQATDELQTVIRDRLARLYGLEVGEEELLFLPGIVTGLNLAFRLFTGQGEAVLVQPPVYSHFITDPLAHGRAVKDPPLVRKGDTYEIDFDAFEASITDRTKLFLLCNPHNPVARVYTRPELERLAEICLRHGLVICSDEIHCELLYPGHRHIPIASLDREVADRTVTLMAPSKTFNLAGLGCAFAVIKNGALRSTWRRGSQGLIPHVNTLGLTAALAAYKDGQHWLDQVRAYLTANRDLVSACVGEKLPGVYMTRMEATYLAWLDCRGSAIPGDPFDFFLQKAGVALNDGRQYGKGGEGFVRLNFACSRELLTEALHRMSTALSSSVP